MATSLTKGLIVAGGLAGTSVATGGVYYLTSKDDSKTAEKNIPSTSTENTNSLIPATKTEKTQSINDLLKNKQLLTKAPADNNKWTTPWNSFVEAHRTEAPKDPWKFVGWKINTNNAESLEAFKDQCVALGGQKVSGTDDKVFVEVNKYCAIAKTSGDV